MSPRALIATLCFLSGPAFAEGLYPELNEFGPETLSIAAATEALFDAMEAETAARPEQPRLELRLATPGADPVALPLAGTQALSDQHGPVTNLTAYGLTWYPGDTTLAGSVDFVGTWGEGRNLVCGYVTWDMGDAETPVLASLTTSYLSTETLVHLPDQAQHAELLRANCAHGAIEPNFELVLPEQPHFP